MFNLAEVWGYRPDGSNPCRHIQLFPAGKSTHLISDEDMGKLFRQLDKIEAEGLERQRAASTVNAELTLLFWRVGQRIHTEVLAGQRAGYGEEILPTLAEQLVRDYGRSFADKNLRRMVQFAATFPDERIVVSLSRQLSWSHVVALIPLKDPLQRDYYVQMASAERWSVRTLRERVDSMLYERTALSQKPEEIIAQELATLRDAQRMTPALVMRDPYILDFLGLRDSWQESDPEAAIIREMEAFLLELGAGFCFVARQKRIQIDDEDFHLDLLFYNRKLRRLVAVELKIGEFKAAYKGQGDALFSITVSSVELDQILEDQVPPAFSARVHK